MLLVYNIVLWPEYRAEMLFTQEGKVFTLKCFPLTKLGSSDRAATSMHKYVNDINIFAFHTHVDILSIAGQFKILFFLFVC